MNEKYTFPTVSEALPFISSRLLDTGGDVGSRNGRVKEFLNSQIVITDPRRREVLTVNRKANVYAQIAETMWVLSGRNDVEWLSAYLPRAVNYSDDGETWRGGYGPRLRSWPNAFGGVSIPISGPMTIGAPSYIDQLGHVVETLREDRLSRRAVISIYDPKQDIPAGKDVPCNDFIQFLSRYGSLHMTVTVRSNDLMWGWSGINAFEWSVLQEIVANLLGIDVGTITFNIGSLHLYDQHWSRAENLSYEPCNLPFTPFRIPAGMPRTVESVDALINQWFEWEKSCRKGEVTPDGLHNFHEPLFRTWAAAIAYYWTRERHWLTHTAGTRLAVAMQRTPASVLPQPVVASHSVPVAQGHSTALHDRTRAFYNYVASLHTAKDKSYGDSWKKRGEKTSILANMARKVDRLGVGDEFDTAADTVTDLFVYAVKYLGWIDDWDDSSTIVVNSQMCTFIAGVEEVPPLSQEDLKREIRSIASGFDQYVDKVDSLDTETKKWYVKNLAERLAPIARDLWWDENSGDYKGADVD